MKTDQRRAFLGQLLPLAGAALALLGRLRGADRGPASDRKAGAQAAGRGSISVNPAPHAVKRRG
jgi:hypothetical protein